MKIKRLDDIAITGMKGLAIAAILAVSNRPNEPLSQDIGYPLLFGGLALTTYLIGSALYQTFSNGNSSYSKSN